MLIILFLQEEPRNLCIHFAQYRAIICIQLRDSSKLDIKYILKNPRG